MTDAQNPANAAKAAAAKAALAYVEPGMSLGLGTGSTAEFLLQGLAARIRDEGLKIRAVPTSAQTKARAESLGIPLVSLDTAGRLDLTIDGADELDSDLCLIKGGGAALLHEKIVAAASDRMIVIAGADKHVAQLGAFPLPVEIIRFGAEVTLTAIQELLQSLGQPCTHAALRRKDGALLLTDEGHFIADLSLGAIKDPATLSRALNTLPGVVENGLFIGLADLALLGNPDGSATLLRPGGAAPANLFAGLKTP